MLNMKSELTFTPPCEQNTPKESKAFHLKVMKTVEHKLSFHHKEASGSVQIFNTNFDLPFIFTK
jgi:hypothetical protein